MKQNIVIVGVGGQGTLLASRILGQMAMERGDQIKVSEVHGMSQRGGSVITYVRVGEEVFSPMIDLGGADCVLAFERLEALRALPYLKRDGMMLVNTSKILPMPVISGAATYPEDTLERVAASCRLIAMDALKLATDAGEARAVNLVLMGALCRLTEGDKALYQSAIRACVPSKLYDVNWRAFEAGYLEAGKSAVPGGNQ